MSSEHTIAGLNATTATYPDQPDVVCGVKIMGNMVWFMDSDEPPRQVSALERKLITALLAK